jgi:hypothetical protein
MSSLERPPIPTVPKLPTQPFRLDVPLHKLLQQTALQMNVF